MALVESGISRRQVCVDLGISRSSLQKWIMDWRLETHGMSPSGDPAVAKEMSVAFKRIRELEARKRGITCSSCVSFAGGDRLKRIFPTVESLIAKGKATLTVAARVLGFSRQAFYKWRAKPVSDRQAQELQLTAKIRLIHAEDPEFGYRFIADELGGQGVQICERWGWRLCSRAQVFSVIARRKPRGTRTGAPVHDDLL